MFCFSGGGCGVLVQERENGQFVKNSEKSKVWLKNFIKTVADVCLLCRFGGPIMSLEAADVSFCRHFVFVYMMGER